MNVKDTFRNLDKKFLAGLSKKKLPSLQQFKYVRLLLSKKELLIVRVCWGVIALGLIMLGTRIYLGHRTVVPAIGGQYSEGMVGSPLYINPLLVNSEGVDYDLSRLLFRGLLQKNAQGEFVPDLAQSITHDADNTTYTITLRENSRWHDGEKITSDDVVFTLQSIQDPDWQSPLAPALSGVDVRKIDDRTVTVHLKKAFAPFESLLTVGIVPLHIWSLVAPSTYRLNEQNTKPIGSGPYKFASLSKDKSGHIKSYILQRFGDYGSDGAHTGPYLSTIEVKFYPTEDDATQALSEGNVDALALTANKGIKPRNKSNEYALQLPRFTALFFNTTNKDLKNKSMRQALAQAIDKDTALNEAFNGQTIGRRINSPILEGMPGYDASITGYQYAPTSSSALLSSLGWTIGNASTFIGTSSATSTPQQVIRKKGSDTLSFTITTIDHSNNVELARAIKKQWAALGIATTVDVVDPNQFIRDVIRGRKFDMVIFSGIYADDPDYYPFWHSSQVKDPGLNISSYQNTTVDGLLEKVRSELDTSTRADLYKQFQTLVLADEPAVFIYQSLGSYFLPDEIKGVQLDGPRALSSRFFTINQWYVHTKQTLKLFN